MEPAETIERLRGQLVVSCQPVPDGPLDRDDFVVAMAQAAQAAGAGAVRIEGAARVRKVSAAISVPIIGIVKHDLADYAVRITPYIDDIVALSEAGADVIAVDATDRPRPATVMQLLKTMRLLNRTSMADCSSFLEGLKAREMGFDLIGSTLSGYTADTECPADASPDWGLVTALSEQGCKVVAEGRLRTPEHAAYAVASGAYCVTVGSAITRIEHITDWFVQAVKRARHE